MNIYTICMSFITTNFQEILVTGFSGVALTNCFSSKFNFNQFLRSEGVTPRKEVE